MVETKAAECTAAWHGDAVKDRATMAQIPIMMLG
jgi:hypothetical protein